MQRISVTSTNVETIGYDEDSQTLEIEFKNGSVYQYFDVPENIFNELRDAGSIGAYFSSNIKGTYRYSRA